MANYLLVVILSLLFSFGGALADHSLTLPGAGLTPESPFYFLDRLGETVRELFTFNPEAKVKLQLSFAAERISEIKVVLETKGVRARGLEVAQQRLQDNFEKITQVVEREKSRGRDVKSLVAGVADEFEAREEVLKETFEAAKAELKIREEELKDKIQAAREAGNNETLEKLLTELQALKDERKLLKQEKDKNEKALKAEEKKLKRELEDKEEAEEALADAQEDKTEFIEEHGQADFTKFDRLLAQAQELFERGNYQGAEQLAEEASRTLEKLERELKKGEGEGNEEPQAEVKREKEVRGRSFKVEADDAGFYPQSLAVRKGEKVKIVFKIREKGVYFGGLDIRSDQFKTGAVKPGGEEEVEFIAGESFTFTSYWPASGVKKADGKVTVE